MIKKISYKKLFIILILSLGFFTLSSQALIAATPGKIEPPRPEVPIPGIDLKPVTCVPNDGGGYDCSVDWLAEYISGVYDYGLLIGGILAAIMIMAGGLIWLTSGGDVSKVANAKKILTGSITGLVLLFSSFLILQTINPDLVKKKALDIKGPQKVQNNYFRTSCCEYDRSSKKAGNDIENTYCKTVTGNAYGDENICPMMIPDSDSKRNLLTVEYPNTACKDDGKFLGGRWKECERDVVNIDPSSTWLFQGGISAQVGDASPELVNLINCIRGKVDADVGIISSISDSNHIGTLYDCNFPDCCKGGKDGCPEIDRGATSKIHCVHACESCHYGGGKDPKTGKIIHKSFAVDFADDENSAALIKAAKECDKNGYYKVENNASGIGKHIHMSVSACNKK